MYVTECKVIKTAGGNLLRGNRRVTALGGGNIGVQYAYADSTAVRRGKSVKERSLSIARIKTRAKDADVNLRKVDMGNFAVKQV